MEDQVSKYHKTINRLGLKKQADYLTNQMYSSYMKSAILVLNGAVMLSFNKEFVEDEFYRLGININEAKIKWYTPDKWKVKLLYGLSQLNPQ